MKAQDSKNQTLVEQHFFKMLTKNEKTKVSERRASLYKLSNENPKDLGMDHNHERRNTQVNSMMSAEFPYQDAAKSGYSSKLKEDSNKFYWNKRTNNNLSVDQISTTNINEPFNFIQNRSDNISQL